MLFIIGLVNSMSPINTSEFGISSENRDERDDVRVPAAIDIPSPGLLESSEDCHINYDYVVVGNDGHSLYLNGEYIDGGGFGHDLYGTLSLPCGEYDLDVLLYNVGGGGGVLFGQYVNNGWQVASQHPYISLRSIDGTLNAWSVYRHLDCGSIGSSTIPLLGDWPTSFWGTVLESGAGFWNNYNAGRDHWIIWRENPDLPSNSYWVCHTTLVVSIPDDDNDGIPNDSDNCPVHPNSNQEDCDSDGMGDVCAIAEGISQDCNTNSVPDECDLLMSVSYDCNSNGKPDECEPDFDGDVLIDECDPDIDNDGIPNGLDVCDYTPYNGNVIVDPNSDLYGTIRGDIDGDCDCDLDDYAVMQQDITGPGYY